jgi:flagellar hook assembly protein FlgD
MRTLVNDKMAPGYYQAVWNGKNDSGKSVGSGVYIYKFETQEYTQVRKMMFIK